MPYFTNSDEVYKYVAGVFQDALDDPELGPKFAASEVVLKLSYTDPVATIVVDMPSGKVLVGDEASGAKPTVELFMTSDTAHRFWLGHVNVSMALAKGEMRAKGPVPKILKLVPLAKQAFPRYQALLEADGRNDLLAV
jgi:putative sterol carrier protein